MNKYQSIPSFTYIITMNFDNNTTTAFDRFILASTFKRIESRYSMAKLPEHVNYVPSYNIAPGDKSYIINNNQTKEIQQFEFGLRGLNTVQPFIRAEGDRNMNNDPKYSGSKAIFLQPGFNRIIHSQRCLVLADAFTVGIKNGNPYLVYLRGKQRPFSFAGIWNRTKDENTGEIVLSFAIITCPANPLMQKLGYKRMPVILYNEYVSTWLRTSAQLSDILSMLCPYPTNLMNAYPISTRIADKCLNDVSLVQPLGNPVFNENIAYIQMSRLGKKESGENKVHDTLEERMKPGK
jgi:putative SOS response-associated peptidase YedK